MVQSTSAQLRAVLGAVVVALFTGACGGGTSESGDDLTKMLVTSEGSFEMRVPDSWDQTTSLNDVAVLQAADRPREAYAVLIVDPKQPFEGTSLGLFADAQIVKFQEALTSPRVTGPELVIIDDDDALQYEIEGSVEEAGGDMVEVNYLYTFIETPDNFLKIVTWSLSDNFDDNKKALADVSASVRQLKATESTSPAPPEDSPSPGLSPSAEPSPLPTPSVLR